MGRGPGASLGNYIYLDLTAGIRMLIVYKVFPITRLTENMAMHFRKNLLTYCFMQTILSFSV